MTEDHHVCSNGATHTFESDVLNEIAESAGVDTFRLAQPSQPVRAFPFPPNWWHCLRSGPVSGRYNGLMTSPNAGKYALDLRVDIDPRHANSPVLDRVSGDIYQVYTYNFPGGRGFSWRVYRSSWIINSPTITWSRCSVKITGQVSYWQGFHLITNATITIPWGTFTPAGPAEVTLAPIYGAAAKYSCARQSDCFRDVNLEVDVTQSIDTTPMVPSYDTHAHSTRPSNLPQRTLTIEEAYEEAGICMTIRQHHSSIDDSASQFNTWSPAELHDAMETHFSRIGGSWPKWELWGLMCGDYQTSTTAGIMFDAASQYGGAGEAPERQGFAVFRNHNWFDDLPNAAPANQAEAWALRQFLYTWIHEAGHAFNFVHSWNKNRPNSLSWMNYPQNVSGFWSNFEFRFDEEELLHLRHGDRSAVIMGGDAWATGLHLEDSGAEMGPAEGNPPLELLVRSKGYFDCLEEVRVELRLRNLMADVPIPIDSRFDPAQGAMSVYIRKPNGEIVDFEPIFCEVGDVIEETLQPAGGAPGTDRLSEEVSIAFGRTGHYFATPGDYHIRAVYHGGGELMIPSNVHRIRVGAPLTREEDRLAQDYFSFAPGLCMALGGSRSDYLARGLEVLETVSERLASTAAGARVSACLAESYARPFFHTDPESRKLKLTGKADTKKALDLSAKALKVLQADEKMNLGYHKLVRQRAQMLKAGGKADQAKKEVTKLSGDLKKRKVKQAVLDRIASFVKTL